MVVFLSIIIIVAAVFYWYVELVAIGLASWLFVIHLAWLKWIIAHPFLTLTYVAAYFLIGAVWSVVKWWFEETDNVRTAKANFEDRTYKREETWDEYKKSHKTKPSNYKEDFLLWICFWPFSALWTLLDDPIRRLCRRIYEELQGVYQRITDSVWR